MKSVDTLKGAVSFLCKDEIHGNVGAAWDLMDAIDELAHLREVNAELVAALGQLRLEVTHYRETGHGMDHLITAEGEAIRVLLEHHSRAALSKAGAK